VEQFEEGTLLYFFCSLVCVCSSTLCADCVHGGRASRLQGRESGVRCSTALLQGVVLTTLVSQAQRMDVEKDREIINKLKKTLVEKTTAAFVGTDRLLLFESIGLSLCA
jgi:predicted hydrolase (HD superfamily)